MKTKLTQHFLPVQLVNFLLWSFFMIQMSFWKFKVLVINDTFRVFYAIFLFIFYSFNLLYSQDFLFLNVFQLHSIAFHIFHFIPFRTFYFSFISNGNILWNVIVCGFKKWKSKTKQKTQMNLVCSKQANNIKILGIE